MAGLYDKQAELYSQFRPTYPPEWYATFAGLTTRRALAWDVATGNGQAAVGLAEHYERVTATDISTAQLEHAMQHSRIHYLHTPSTLSDDELVSMVGGESSVDLITVAQAIHWFDLPRFYAVANRVLRKPGGVIAVWGYNDMLVCPAVDAAGKRWYETTQQYWRPELRPFFGGYRTLAFPFESVGMGEEGNPVEVEMVKELSFDQYLGMMRSWSAVRMAMDEGIDLLSEAAVKELTAVWGGANLVRTVVYKGMMLAGKVKC
ncbi:uncharacterized protein LOC127258341 [Andrographis paniculata]|uniref:uncharacterized protein LOC127258341 n=1 Tax=Andrographis paniculata TaxID=175694 RepID=UPI0021E7B366|nr:uncharacterized protein LOC127258341 [Andrographis paniculata]